MTQVVSFEDYTPSARFDAIPWTDVRIEESDSATFADILTWTQIDTLALSPLDVDPSDPQSRDFTTSLASDTPDLWYRVIFADGSGNISAPSIPAQNSELLTTPYASVDELARLVKVDAVARRDALERVLLAASAEIDHEVGNLIPYSTPPSLAVEVCLERAVEHWQQAQSPFGLIGAGGVESPAFASSNSWERHAVKLAPLKLVWGLA